MNKIFKNLIFVGIIGLLFAIFFGFGKLKTKQNYYVSEDDNQEIAGYIDFGIYCNNIINDTTNDLYKKGTLFEDKKLSFYDGESIYDVMIRLQKNKKLTMDAEYNELYDTVYVKGLFDLYEFDYGDLSGWVYTLDNESPQIGCSKRKLEDGDRIHWIYTKNLGQDIK